MQFFSSNYVSTQQPSQTYTNQYDTSALRSTGSVIRDERMGNEILARAGPSQHYQHPAYRTHESTKTKSCLFFLKTNVFTVYSYFT
jgi:hypothetical protein